MKKIIKVFVKEIVPIIVGILIAMYINNWNEGRKNRKYIDKISLSINRELIETNKDIKEKISNQESLVDTLTFYLERNEISLIDIIKKNHGIHIPSIKINSWKAVSNSKIELVAYDKITILSNIEEQKDILKMKTDKMVTFTYSNTKETGVDKKELMKLMMQDIINTERNIQEQIISYQQK